MRRFFYCSDQIVIKVSKYVLSGRSDGLASKDNVHYKTQVSLFFRIGLISRCKNVNNGLVLSDCRLGDGPLLVPATPRSD